jgi:hypothetical protein
MTRLSRSTLALAGALVAVACTGPEATKSEATPGPSASPVAPLAVHIALVEGASSSAMGWARTLEEAVTERRGDLQLVADAAAAVVVVRVAAVEPVREEGGASGEGEAMVVRGALVVGTATPRNFNLTYRGAARVQADALARNLRRLAEETKQLSSGTTTASEASPPVKLQP